MTDGKFEEKPGFWMQPLGSQLIFVQKLGFCALAGFFFSIIVPHH
jgi:hypothetical protein